MKVTGAQKRMEKAGFQVVVTDNAIRAYREEDKAEIFSSVSNGNCGKFSFEDKFQCSPTFGLSLKAALDS